MDPTVLAGPAALAIAASGAVIVLWRDHQKDDALKDETIRSQTATLAVISGTVAQFAAIIQDVQKVQEQIRTRLHSERVGDP